jgi:hypothetical protein
LFDHRSAISLVVVAALSGCGDDACPDGACLIARMDGTSPGGELGFRFGAPLDLDGDARVDIVAGARRGGPGGHGEATAWTQDGEVLGAWHVDDLDALFGHVALGVPDLDGDGRADVVFSAPNASIDGIPRGFVDAYSLDGRRLWRATGEPLDGFGWHVERAGDHDGDGVEDLWVGAPSNPDRGRVYLVAGNDGRVLRTIASTRRSDQFGWYVVPTGDLDGDGVADVAIGAPTASVDGRTLGTVTLASAATGDVIRELVGELPDHQFGEMLASLDDLDGDGLTDLAIGAPSGVVATAPGGSEIHVVASGTGERLHLLTEVEPNELYGRMLATLDDIDGDGVRDLAIGAPWAGARRGRVEVRSMRSFAVLADVRGSEDNGWLGWHIAPAGDRGFAVSLLHVAQDTGAVEIYLTERR